jgi:thiol:disulfide interchange protein DsbD
MKKLPPFDHIRIYSAILLLVFTVLQVGPIFAGTDPFGGGQTGQPGTSEGSLVQTEAVFSYGSVAAGGTYPAAVKVSIDPAWHINSAQPYEDWLIPAELVLDTVNGIASANIEFPKAHEITLFDQPFSVYSGDVVFFFEVNVGDDVAAGDYQIPVSFTYQPCNDYECRAPQTHDMTIPVTVGEMGAATHVELFADRGTTPRVATTEPETTTGQGKAATGAQPENDLERLINEYGFWGYLLALGLAFVTGLLLSFSPCTYPMIPITVSVFAGQQRSVGRGFVLSLFYVGAMAVMYGIMGLIVSLVGGVFGAWLASPSVVIGIAIVFVVFALSMFGLYELQVPMSLRNKLGAKAQQGGGGVVGSIILGVIAALVVSPCVGPFVAGILLYVATSGSPYLGFLVLFVFALGLGTLYVIIGTFSSAISKLPGAGEWMEQIKKFFGFVLLLMAVYFLQTLLPASYVALITGLILLAYGTFGGGLDRLTTESGFFPRLKKFLGILALLIGAYLLVGTLFTQGFILPAASGWLPMGSGGHARAEAKLIDWETDLQSGLAKAESEGKPVLVDTWATWCANCRVLDKKTFGDQTVAREAKRFVPIKVQLETADSPITRDFMKRFNMKHYSLPTVILMDSDGNVQRVLQGVVGPDEMLEYMQAVK